MVPLRYLGPLSAALVAMLTLGCRNNSADGGLEPDCPPEAPAKAPEPKVEMKPIIAVTAEAVTALTTTVNEKGGAEPWYLRVRVVPGGCSGFLHKLDLDLGEPVAADFTFESAGVKVVVEKRQVDLLRGSQVSYGREGDKQGFMIKNPNFEGKALKKSLAVLWADVPPPPKPDPAELQEKTSRVRRMAKADPENELAHFRLGQLLMDTDQFREAAESFKQALTLAPEFSKAYQLLGECHVKLGQKDRAVAVLTKGWKIADQRDDDAVRDAIANLLSELGASVPLNVRGKSSK